MSKIIIIAGVLGLMVFAGISYKATHTQVVSGVVQVPPVVDKSEKLQAPTEVMVSKLSSTTLATTTQNKKNKSSPQELKNLTNEEWRKRLSKDQYAVLRLGGTETPYTSDLVKEKRKGSYVTADCGELVFRSEQKFDSGTGWPSFYAPANKSSVIEKTDTTLGISRTEIISPVCKSHLGHVFNDAPQTPTGLRYCINGIALRFIPDTVE